MMVASVRLFKHSKFQWGGGVGVWGGSSQSQAALGGGVGAVSDEPSAMGVVSAGDDWPYLADFFFLHIVPSSLSVGH